MITVEMKESELKVGTKLNDMPVLEISGPFVLTDSGLNQEYNLRIWVMEYIVNVPDGIRLKMMNQFWK